MTSQAGQQVITIHMLPNISRSKDNQATKFGQLIEYNVSNNVRNFFFENYAEDEARLVPGSFFFLKKALYKRKASSQQLRFSIFW